jgi:hypothetical protein
MNSGSSSEVDKLASKLKNAYGHRARIMVDVGACDCPNTSCDGTLDTTDEGALDDAAWCEECGWDGTCRELLTGEALSSS